MSDTVLLERTGGGVAVVTLNRPDALNSLVVEMKTALLQAVNSLVVEMKTALLQAVEAVRDDDGVRAVVLTGAGRAFCVGQDLREHAALLEAGDPAPLSTVREHYNPLVTALAEMGKPTVAAVNGTAAGAGLGLACAADFRIGATGARFTTAFTGIGLTADSGLSWTLPRLVGSGRATALLLLAEPFSAEQALEMGLLNAAVAPEAVLPAALELAERLAQGPTTAYACVKASLRFAADSTLVEALAEEDRQQTLAGGTQDHAAAVRSFLAKQPAVFSGR